MKYTNVTEGEFVGRNNRFTAEVLIGGVQETVHVKNTGRRQEEITLLLSRNINTVIPAWIFIWRRRMRNI